MKNLQMTSEEDHDQGQIELPPGFRFHPTDEELITHYLSPKVLDTNFSSIAIGEADLNKSEPWDLPGRAKMGEKEWYFFCVKDRKYPTGLRTNRATESGYWKATGKDKEIYRSGSKRIIVGMKKTLVFYRGRAPKGDKSNWVMHEYRLEPKFPPPPHLLQPNEWVICRIFNKSSGADKRTHISDLLTDHRNSPPALLPPLMEYYSHSHSPYSGETRVTCFSNNKPIIMDDTKPFYNFKTHHFSSSSSSSYTNPPPPPPLNIPADSIWMQQQPGNSSIVRMLVENQTAVNPKVEVSQYAQGFSYGIGVMEEDQYNPSSTSDDPIDLQTLWNY